MELIGTIVVYIIMACAIAGCLASVIKPESELGQQFVAGIDSIIADEGSTFRALEVAGAIGMMLCGAFPMVYLIRRYLAKPLAKIGGAVGLSSDATAGLLAASANVLALFSMVKDLRAKDKVICMAFAVCSAFLFGDHLSFTANFQPNLIVVVLAGKLAAGICAIVFANLLAVKKAEQLEREAGEDVLYDAERAFGNAE